LPGNNLFRSIVLAATLAVTAIAGGKGFRSEHLLAEHFSSYGRQFGAISQAQYLRYAQQLRDSRPSKNVLESRRQDGGGAKFDRRRGWFVAYDADRTIMTFFIPRDGIRYFERQMKAPPRPE
jgi:hypothetical protein